MEKKMSLSGFRQESRGLWGTGLIQVEKLYLLVASIKTKPLAEEMDYYRKQDGWEEVPAPWNYNMTLVQPSKTTQS